MKYKSKKQSAGELDEYLADYVASGQALLPSERELSELLNISRFTLRSLLEEREKSGVLLKKPKGRACALQQNPGSMLFIAEGRTYIENPVWNDLFVLLNPECGKRNIRLELLLYKNSSAKEVAEQIAVSDAGVLINTMYTAELLEYKEVYGKKKMIFTDQRCENEAEYMVSQDNVLTGRTAARLLGENGYTRPLLLCNLFESDGMPDMIHLFQEQGFSEECLKAGLDFNSGRDVIQTFGIAASTDRLIRFLDAFSHFSTKTCREYDCCFATDEYVARLFDSFIRLRKCRISPDFPIITASCHGLCHGDARTITSLNARLDRQAEAISDMSFALLTGKRIAKKKCFFEPEYTEGETFHMKKNRK